MKIVDCEQGTPEWFSARCGKVTASRVADVTARTRTGYGASRANYMAQLVAERLTGSIAESYTNAAMQWGKDHEDEAASLYAFKIGVELTKVGLVVHPRIDMSAASPDRIVSGGGLVEIKCPNTSTHIETLLGGSIDAKYVKQMQWQMACVGADWCDFVSYDPRMPTEMQLHVQRLERDSEAIKDLETEVEAFLAEVSEKVDRLTHLYRMGSAA